jgi:hypothetical protein
MQHFWYLANGHSRGTQLELYCGPHLVISSVLLSVTFLMTWQVHGSALSWRVLNERSSETDCTRSLVRNIALGLPKLPGNNDASKQRSILTSGLTSILILVDESVDYFARGQKQRRSQGSTNLNASSTCVMPTSGRICAYIARANSCIDM